MGKIFLEYTFDVLANKLSSLQDGYFEHVFDLVLLADLLRKLLIILIRLLEDLKRSIAVVLGIEGLRVHPKYQ